MMRHSLSSLVVCALMLSAVGCQLLRGRGPMTESLVTSRKLCQEGIAAIEKDQWEQAEKLLAEAVQVCPTDSDARRWYADALWHRGQRGQAVAHLEEATRLAGDHAELRVRLAEMRLAMGQVELARRGAESALDLDPKLARAWAIRGRVLRAEGTPRDALADYHRALGLAPDDRTVQLEIAELYRELNEPRRALAALQSLADTYSPGDEPQQVLYLEGLAYAAMERWDDAVNCFAAAGARGRPTSEILCQMGRAQLFAGRPEQAATSVREALALDPTHPASLELLGQVQLVLGPEGTLRR